jgi:hypothetical protein
MDIYTGNLTSGFRYIPQDNYIFCNPQSGKYDYLYSDSATSCIILIVTGQDKDGLPLVALAHLSRVGRFKAFFDLVDEKFSGALAVYAQGANPAFPVKKGENYSYDAMSNVITLINWVNEKSYIPDIESNAPEVYIQQCTLAVGSGDPNEGFGGYGINVNSSDKDYMKVSNKYFNLKPTDRDPEKGIQTLFCIFGDKDAIHNVEDSFTDEEKAILVENAMKPSKRTGKNWLAVLEEDVDKILDNHSTTPEFEPRWFVDTLIESAEYVRDYKGE